MSGFRTEVTKADPIVKAILSLTVPGWKGRRVTLIEQTEYAKSNYLGDADRAWTVELFGLEARVRDRPAGMVKELPRTAYSGPVHVWRAPAGHALVMFSRSAGVEIVIADRQLGADESAVVSDTLLQGRAVGIGEFTSAAVARAREVYVGQLAKVEFNAETDLHFLAIMSATRRKDIAEARVRNAPEGAVIPAGKAKPVKATDTNIFALRQVSGGQEVFSNRIAKVDFPHIKRCFLAGLVEIVDRSSLRLTPAGIAALSQGASS